MRRLKILNPLHGGKENKKWTDDANALGEKSAGRWSRKWRVAVNNLESYEMRWKGRVGQKFL
jgi:hypothetical protein